MQFEETDEKNEVPAFVKEFLDSNLFQVSNDKPKRYKLMTLVLD